MNLLPKSHKEFSEKDYWNKFFKKRGNKAFEWYGEYLELCGQLHKYIKQKDNILITGCGNSSLSADLYDVGFENITNIDVSEVVIKQMKTINSNRKNMKFLNMDATSMSFENDEFSVVLDKGTLDALMSDDSAETMNIIDKYFSEIKRVLKVGGRFVCVSLLQSHIVSKLLEVFCDKSWMFRVVRCHEAEEKNAENGDGMTLPVFIVVATKFKEMPQLILEVCMAGEKMLRLSSPEELLSHVKSAQDAAFVTNGLARTNLDNDDEVSLELMLPDGTSPRYTLYIVDQNKSQPAKQFNKYAVFIVPQGRESEWLFGTPSGRRQLQDSARFGRLVVAVLHRGHLFESLDAVKEELTHTAKMLIPNGFTGQIPFLSLGSDVGKRVCVHRGSSQLSGKYVVEDVDVEGGTRRRLVFLDNQMLVQSEGCMKEVKKKGKIRLVVDFGQISTYHALMCAGVAGWVASCGADVAPAPVAASRDADIAPGTAASGDGDITPAATASCDGDITPAATASCDGDITPAVAVLGLGGGGLCMFLRKCYDHLKITAVDIDPVMLEVAQNHFNLKTDHRLEVQIKDGLDFLRDEAEKGSVYSCVMYDMDSKDRSVGLSCPPQQFLQEQVLGQVKALIGATGYFILNLVCRDTTLQVSIIASLKLHFKHLASIALHEEVNEVILASNCPFTRDSLEAAVKSLNTRARDVGLVKVKCVDLKDFMQSVTIIA